MNIEKYQIRNGATLVKDSAPLKEGENISFKVKAGEELKITLFLRKVSEEHAKMQGHIAEMNREAAQNGDACVGNCMTCEDRESCEHKKTDTGEKTRNDESENIDMKKVQLV